MLKRNHHLFDKIDEAKVLLSEATKKIDQACSKGVIVKNTAARKKYSLSKNCKYFWSFKNLKIIKTVQSKNLWF